MTKAFAYDDVPLPSSELGEEAWERGRALARERGVALDHVMWDCDELLWDWALRVRASLKTLHKLARRNLAHYEYLRTKPGVWELIWGLRHGTLEAGIGDGFLRLFTNGYTWRVYRVAQNVPGMLELVGPPAKLDRYAGWLDHPRIFTRPNYAALVDDLLASEVELDGVEDGAASMIRRHIETRPLDSTLKLPELPKLMGKDGFDEVRFLVDDSRRNVTRFAATGRVGIYADVPAKRRFKGSTVPRPPNTVWSDPVAYLDEVCTPLGLEVAAALEAGVDAREGDVLVARAPDREEAHRPGAPINFELDIPGERIGGEWVEPMRALKAKVSA